MFRVFSVIFVQDGVISDMDRTIDRIVTASKLPLSIVIVGVGGADFSNMVCSGGADMSGLGGGVTSSG